MRDNNGNSATAIIAGAKVAYDIIKAIALS